MTPPPPPAQPPRSPIVPPAPPVAARTSPPAPPPPPLVPLDPGVPWGPIRVKWHGRYLRPEVASLIFGSALLLTLLVGFGCWRAFKVLSRPAPIPQPAPIVNRFPPPPPRKPPHRSRAKPLAAENPSSDPANAPTSDPSRYPTVRPNSPSSKPSADVPSGSLATAALVPPPVIIAFRASSADLEPGSSAMLRWAVAGEVTAVSITPGPGALQPSGELEVRPERTTRYTLAATGPGGTASQTLILRVGVAALPSGPATASQ